MFVEFRRFAFSKANSKEEIKPFQRIVILIRDHQYPFGSLGGESFLQKYLSFSKEMLIPIFRGVSL